jgi:hypothetical protein
MPYDHSVELTFEIFIDKFIDKKNLYPWWRNVYCICLHLLGGTGYYLTTTISYHSNIGGYLRRAILEGPRILSHPLRY